MDGREPTLSRVVVVAEEDENVNYNFPMRQTEHENAYPHEIRFDFAKARKSLRPEWVNLGRC